MPHIRILAIGLLIALGAGLLIALGATSNKLRAEVTFSCDAKNTKIVQNPLPFLTKPTPNTLTADNIAALTFTATGKESYKKGGQLRIMDAPIGKFVPAEHYFTGTVTFSNGLTYSGTFSGRPLLAFEVKKQTGEILSGSYLFCQDYSGDADNTFLLNRFSKKKIHTTCMDGKFSTTRSDHPQPQDTDDSRDNNIEGYISLRKVLMHIYLHFYFQVDDKDAARNLFLRYDQLENLNDSASVYWGNKEYASYAIKLLADGLKNHRKEFLQKFTTGFELHKGFFLMPQDHLALYCLSNFAYGLSLPYEKSVVSEAKPPTPGECEEIQVIQQSLITAIQSDEMKVLIDETPNLDATYSTGIVTGGVSNFTQLIGLVDQLDDALPPAQRTGKKGITDLTKKLKSDAPSSLRCKLLEWHCAGGKGQRPTR